jgi:hypothetical protein
MVPRLLAGAASLLLLARSSIGSDAESALLVPGMPIQGKGSTFLSPPTSVSLSSDGTVMAVGTPGDNSSAPTWVYRYANGAWAESPDMPLSHTVPMVDSPATSVSLSLDGTVLAAGVPGYVSHGVTWVYRHNGSAWDEAPGALPPTVDWLALSLSEDGSVLAVGGPGE